ncbi:hypothetical protein NL676_037699 [Syzygium grande]|nr:hypothetical protein NL676_037699 [Syzygium grande]
MTPRWGTHHLPLDTWAPLSFIDTWRLLARGGTRRCCCVLSGGTPWFASARGRWFAVGWSISPHSTCRETGVKWAADPTVLRLRSGFWTVRSGGRSRFRLIRRPRELNQLGVWRC